MTQKADLFLSLAIQLMTIIIMIVKIVSAAGIVAAFSYLLDYCLMDGSIFGRWLPWLARTITKCKSRIIYNTFINSDGTRHAKDEMFIQYCIKNPIWKILGGCPTCSNVWIAAGSFFLFHYWWSIPYMYMAFHVILASMILRRGLLRGE